MRYLQITILVCCSLSGSGVYGQEDYVAPRPAYLFAEVYDGDGFTELNMMFPSRDGSNNIELAFGTGSDEYSDLLMGCEQPPFTAYGVMRTYSPDFSELLAEWCMPYPTRIDGDPLPQSYYYYPQPNGDTILFTNGEFPERGRDMVVERKNGDMIWRKHYGSIGSETVFGMIESSDGHFISSCPVSYPGGDIGELYGEPGVSSDMWVVKIDTAGDIVWSRVLGGSDGDIFMSMVPTDDGGFIAFGATASDDHDIPEHRGNTDLWVIRLDGDGNTLWSRTYGGTGIDGSGLITATRGIKDQFGPYYYVLTCTGSEDGDIQYRTPIKRGSDGDYDFDFWLLKLDLEGNLIWERTYGSSYMEVPYAICQGEDGSLWLGGNSERTDGEFVNGHLLEHYGGENDAWVLHVDEEDGDPLHQMVIGGGNGDYMRGLYPLPDGTVLAGGVTGGTNTVDPRSPGLPLYPYHSDAAFIFRFAPWVSSVDEPDLAKPAWELYPNPSGNGQVQLRLGLDPGGAIQFSLMDIQGRELLSSRFTGREYGIATGGLVPGTYTVALTFPDGRHSEKKLVIR